MPHPCVQLASWRPCDVHGCPNCRLKYSRDAIVSNREARCICSWQIIVDRDHETHAADVFQVHISRLQV